MTIKATIISIALAILIPFTANGELHLLDQETVPAGSGVKSVLVHPGGERVYAINLEGMSVHEFDRATRKLLRKLIFIKHQGEGYNYKTREPINSYEEKPVEGHFTHGGRYLWISLHNAGGVVVWDLVDGGTAVDGSPSKEAIVRTYGKGGSKKYVDLLFIKTGKTPKVITSSPDGKRLFVANWHSNTVSFLSINSPAPEGWKVKREVWASIPRGLLVTPDSKHLYIAEMGGSSIAMTTTAKYTKPVRTRLGLNPRHLLMHDGTLYASLNINSQIAALKLNSGSINRVDTCKAPRTIAISPEAGILFSVCYKGEMLEAFALPDLTPLGAWESKLAPVGIDVYEAGDGLLEVWVANYRSGTLSVFSFSQKESSESISQIPEHRETEHAVSNTL